MNRIEKRFRELVIKEAMRLTTPEDVSKLDRYQKLRRYQFPRTPRLARTFWESRCAMKLLTYFQRKAEGLKASRPKYPPTPFDAETGDAAE